MAFEVVTLKIDLIHDTASVALTDRDLNRHVTVAVPVQTPGNQPESKIRESAIQATKQAIQDALAAL